MSHADSRRGSSNDRSQQSLHATAPLQLTRTQSQEFNAVESVVVDDTLPETLKPGPDDEEPTIGTAARPHSARYLVLLCGLLTNMSFGVTQVPLVYVFRLMTCDAYYDTHPSEAPNSMPLLPAALSETSFARSFLDWAFVASMLSYTKMVGMSSSSAITTTTDRCSIREIEASTALSISLLGASTTVFGIANLFISGSLIKRWGVKPTLLLNVFFPALRLFVQTVGVEAWGSTGIIIIQSSQIINILGGPSGYLLVLNTFVTEVVEYDGRTAALGRLGGCTMLGAAIGFLLGGTVADRFGIKAPFYLTFAMFLSSCLYVAVFLPHIPPSKATVPNTSQRSPDGNSLPKKKKSGYAFLDPLVVLAPQKFISGDGKVRTEYGVFLLCCGTFLGILATGYLQTLFQLFATDVFEFGTQSNGWLIFMYSSLRGLFLTLAFPQLISLGRRMVTRREMNAQRVKAERPGPDENQPLLSGQDNREHATDSNNNEEPEVVKEAANIFDLMYTRFSLLADGSLTLLCSFVREGWQMYLVAAILPFAAGTGSAAKGTILQMVGRHATSAERTDALAGLSLVDNMARLSTTFVFGVVFAAFANIGRPELVFTCNAAVALIGFCVLLMARFPPDDSRPLDKEDPSASDTASASASASAPG